MLPVQHLCDVLGWSRGSSVSVCAEESWVVLMLFCVFNVLQSFWAGGSCDQERPERVEQSQRQRPEVSQRPCMASSQSQTCSPRLLQALLMSADCSKWWEKSAACINNTEYDGHHQLSVSHHGVTLSDRRGTWLIMNTTNITDSANMTSGPPGTADMDKALYRTLAQVSRRIMCVCDQQFSSGPQGSVSHNVCLVNSLLMLVAW